MHGCVVWSCAVLRAPPGLVQVHSVPSASRSFVSFKQQLLLSMGKIVKSHGAGVLQWDHNMSRGWDAAPVLHIEL